MKQQIYQKIYVIFLVSAIVLAVYAFTQNNGEQVRDTEYFSGGTPVMWERVNQIDADTREYIIPADNMNSGAYSLIFFTRHQFVEVYVDGQLKYSFGIRDSKFGNTPGTSWNFVEIPYGADQVRVVLQAAYTTVRQSVPGFLYAKPLEYYNHIVCNSLFDVILSAVDMILGMILMIYWLLTRKGKKVNGVLLYIGLFSFLMGVWSLGESDAAAPTLRNQQAASFFRYLLINLMGIPFLFYIRDFLRLTSDKVWTVLCTFCLAWMPFPVILQIFNIADMKQTAVVTHFSFVLIILYLIIGTLIKLRSVDEKEKQNTRITLYGAVLLMLAIIVVLFGYYVNIRFADEIGRIAFLIYIILIGFTTVNDVSTAIDEGKKAEIYKELATKDILTGMYNRNAYIQVIHELREPAGHMVVTFDLNNLKKCNDTQGHMYGDKYIIASANIIDKSFSAYGRCYRIGGDEFCVIIPNAKLCNIDRALDDMKMYQVMYNSTSEDIKIEIACGYALYDSGLDADIESTRSRADNMMYSNKRALKGQTKS